MITKIFAERIKKDFLRLAIFSLITLVTWLGFATYRTLNRSKISADVKKQLSPLTASLELDTMEQVSQRLVTPLVDWGSIGVTRPEIAAEPETASEASASGELNND